MSATGVRLVKDELEWELRSCGRLPPSRDDWYRRHLCVQFGMDNVMAVVAGMVADEVNLSARARMSAREKVGLLRRVLTLWFRVEWRYRGGRGRGRGRGQSAPVRRGERRRGRGREQSDPARVMMMTNVPPDGVLALRDEVTGEVLTSSVGNVAFLLGFQRMKPEEQIGTIVGDPCALVERID